MKHHFTEKEQTGQGNQTTSAWPGGKCFHFSPGLTKTL